MSPGPPVHPVYFVGAGPGDPELLTLKAARLLRSAQVVVYAGSLVNPTLLDGVPPSASLRDSSGMTLGEILTVLEETHRQGHLAVRLHTGESSLYGAIAEQIERLEARGVPCQVVPGVSSFQAAAATLKREFTVPGVSQTLILTRVAGKTPVPDQESLGGLAAHGSSLCLFLSAAMAAEVERDLGRGYSPDTPVAVVEKASWPEERVITGRLSELTAMITEAGITRTALILVGRFLEAGGQRSRLYHGRFSHSHRPGGAMP
ncbi:MAG: precorrin-4 C(11)-methyltransferase [Bacillota bacterium]